MGCQLPDDIKMGMATATLALRTILNKISLLPEAEFEQAFHALFTGQALGNKTLQLNSYQRMYRSLLAADEYEEWRRQAYQPLPTLPEFPVPNPILPWVSEVSGKYNAALAQDRVEGRFRAMTPCLYLTLAHMQREAGYTQWLADLRAAGWLDWQIMMAMFNVVLNYKVMLELTNQGLDPTSEDYARAMQPAFAHYQRRDECDCYLPFPLSSFQNADFQHHLEHSVIYALQSFGLENKAGMPNAEAVRGLLQTRFNLQQDTPDKLNSLRGEVDTTPLTTPENITQAWQSATALRLMPSPNRQEPAAAVVVFDQAGQGNYGYELLLDTYANFTTALHLRVADNLMHLSLYHPPTEAVITLPVLRYDPAELDAFVKQQPASEPLVLMTGYADGKQLIIIPTRSPFQPFVATGYRYEPPQVSQ